MPTDKPRPQIAEKLDYIDALRGIAAVIVALIFHQFYLIGGYRTGPLDGYPVASWLHAYGWTMVDLFFVLSGFVFSHVYGNDEKLRTRKRASRFWNARIARLYPVHIASLLAVTLMLAFVDVKASNDLHHFVLNLFMLQESGLNDGMTYNIPAWSLSVELMCYFAFFLLASTRALVPASLLIIPACFFLTTMDSGTVDHIARGFVGFFFGVLVYRYGWKIMPFGLLVAGAAFWIEPSLGVILALTAWPMAILVAKYIRPLSWRPFQWLGERSLSLYLWHYPVFLLVSAYELPRWAALLVGLPLAVLVSDLSYRRLEIPARQWLRNPPSLKQFRLSW